MTEASAWVMIPKFDKDKTGIVLEIHPLVLCKDCRYYHGKNEECGAIGFYPPSGDWFCADGEKWVKRDAD